ncbi:hypothetical protein PFISCL1PPCAC_22947, partial [Pristionchus fissidentatus]
GVLHWSIKDVSKTETTFRYSTSSSIMGLTWYAIHSRKRGREIPVNVSVLPERRVDDVELRGCSKNQKIE